MYREFLTLKPYANISRDPVLLSTRYQIKKNSCCHRGLNPRRTFCAIIFQLLFQLYYLVVIAKTESCIREPKIRNQLLFHALYLSDDRVCVCVCVFFPFILDIKLDIPAGVTQEKGHTGFLIHLLSAVRALIFLARRVQPFLSLVDREVEFCVLTV